MLLSPEESKSVLVDSSPWTDGDNFNGRGGWAVDDSRPPDTKTPEAMEIVQESLSAGGILKDLLQS
jgi:hypothetical protein